MRRSAVLLDAGGVLLQPDPQVVAPVLETLGISASAEAVIELAYRRVALFDREDINGWREADAALARQVGLSDRATEFVSLLDGVFGRHRSVPAPDSREALLKLSQAGYTIGVVSNSDGTLAARLAEDRVCATDATPRVRCIVDSAVVGVRKPDPRIFRIALDLLDKVSPEACYYIGDSLKNDVAPSSQLGMTPIHIDPLHICHHRDEHAHAGSLRDAVAHVLATS